MAEIEACNERCEVVCKKGSQLISEGNSSAEEIRQLIVDLQSSVEKLRKLAETRAERLNEAAQSFQVSVKNLAISREEISCALFFWICYNLFRHY